MLGRTHISNGKHVNVDWDVVAKALCVLIDYDESKGSEVCRRINMLKQPLSDLVEVAERDEKSARFWCTKVAEWKWWIAIDDNEAKPDPVSLCCDFDDPEIAADFLSCPPLSEAKCARLFTGVDTPGNAYERHVAATKHPGRQNEIMMSEISGPHKRVIYRLCVLHGDSRRQAIQQIKAAEQHGFSLLERGSLLSAITSKELDSLIGELIRIRESRRISEMTLDSNMYSPPRV